MKYTVALFVIVGMTTITAYTSCKGFHKKKAGSTDEAISELKSMPGINAGSGSFSVRAPAGWRNYDTLLSGIKFHFVQAPRGSNPRFTPNMNIFTQKIGDAQLDDYFKGVMIGAAKSRNYEEIGSGRKNIDGHSARWLQYSSSTENGTPMDIIFTALIADGICYNITEATAKGEMPLYKPSFDTVVNSFTIGATPEPVPAR